MTLNAVSALYARFGLEPGADGELSTLRAFCAPPEGRRRGMWSDTRLAQARNLARGPLAALAYPFCVTFEEKAVFTASAALPDGTRLQLADDLAAAGVLSGADLAELYRWAGPSARGQLLTRFGDVPGHARPVTLLNSTVNISVRRRLAAQPAFNHHVALVPRLSPELVATVALASPHMFANTLAWYSRADGSHLQRLALLVHQPGSDGYHKLLCSGVLPGNADLVQWPELIRSLQVTQWQARPHVLAGVLEYAVAELDGDAEAIETFTVLSEHWTGSLAGLLFAAKSL